MLQARLGENTTQSNTKARYYQLLSDKQQWVAGEYDFPYLEDRFDVQVPVHGRYVAFPTLDNSGANLAMNMERPYKVERFWVNTWEPLEYGIGADEYNAYNSDQAGQFQDPISRWRWSSDDTGSGVGQFEVWPVPVTAQTVRFTGQRALKALVADADKAELDDQLLVLLVAADLLARSKQADAQQMALLAAERLRAVRAMYPTRPKGLNFGGNQSKDPSLKPQIKLVSIAGSR